MGRAEYWDPVTQSRKPIKSGSIVNSSGLEYTPDQIKGIDNKINNLSTDVESHKADYTTFKDNTNIELESINNFKADYEYQIAAIVDRQIRLQKLSDTNILKFRLDEDIEEGTQITISLDDGATSKPLQDFEGEPITELEKGFVEVVAEATFFTLRPRGGGLKYFEGLLAESPSYGGVIYALASDENFIYVTGDKGKIVKLDKNNLAIVAESINHKESGSGYISAIAVDEDFVYVETSAVRLAKLDKNNLTVVATSDTAFSNIQNIVIDGDFIYLTSSTSKVTKINKSSLTRVSESAVFYSSIDALVLDSDFIYLGYSRTNTPVVKVDKSTLTKTAESALYSNVSALTLDNSYIYGSPSGRLVKLYKSSLNERRAIPSYRGIIYALASDENFIYTGGQSSNITVDKLDKEFLSLVASSVSSGNYIRAMLLDGDFIYVSTTLNDIVRKFDKMLVDYYKFKDLTLIPMEV